MSDFRKVCPQCNNAFQDEDELEILTECPDDGTTLVFETIDPMVGIKLADRYQIEDLIGRGATSTVYRAADMGSSAPQKQDNGEAPELTNSLVAVKVLHPHLSGDAAVVKRLSQEAKSLREFSHRNVVNVLSLGVTKQGQPFLVMELVRGQSLLEYLRQNGALDKQLCHTIFDQILDAIGAAHQRGILHRDLKPGNIMLTRDNEGEYTVKLLDFGIAKIVPLQGDTFFRLTQTGEMMGSLLYMSPEQCLEQDWDQRGDIYSLGCVFYEALTARAPLMGRTAFETMNKHLSEVPQALSMVRPDLQFAPGIEHIVMKMLAKDPLVRYQTAEEARADLKLVQDGNGASLISAASPKSIAKLFGISRLKGKEADSAKSLTMSTAAGDPRTASEILEAKRSRQRKYEIGIFVVLILIWGVPLLLAFAYSPNALVSACLFGVLLPFLAAVSAMVVVRVGQLTGASTHSLFSLFTGTRETPHNPHLLLHILETGALLLGTESGLLFEFFRSTGPSRVIEPYQRVQALPLFILGNSGTGKTHLLASLASNDVDDARRAQFLLSPDGELANLVMRWIASHPQANTMSKRVLLIDLDQELSRASIAEGGGFSAVQEVCERIVEAMVSENNGRDRLSSEQSYLLHSSLAMLLASNESLASLPDFLSRESKRKEVFKKLPQWRTKGQDKDPLSTMQKMIEERSDNGWDELTKPLLSICNRFPLQTDAAALRIFWQHSTLIREAISKRKVMLVKGCNLSQSPLFFRLIFNEVLKERRPSARLSDAESYPVVYIDDVVECGIADRIMQIAGSPTETGVEFLVSAKTLAEFSQDDVKAILENCGLGVFAVGFDDSTAVAMKYKSFFQKTPPHMLTSLDLEATTGAGSRLDVNEFRNDTLPNLPKQNYVYMQRALGGRPMRLLAPHFPEIRITEVEWSVVESMRTGWMFNI